MAASKRTKKEFVEEAKMLHSPLEKLRRGKAKHKQMEDALKESKEHAKIFALYQHAILELREFYVREDSFEQMLQKTTDLFAKSFGYYMAWYGELKSDEKVIIPKVWAGKYEKYLDGLRLELDDSKDAKCAMSLAIVNKEPFGYADLEHDKDFEKWRPLALKYGYRSNQAIPLIIDGKSVGAFLVYSTRPRAFSEDLIQYLVGIANELATIVENVTGRKKAGEAYRTLVDHSLQGLVIFQEGRVVFANQAMAEITGYTVDEMLATSSQQVQAFVHPEDRALVWGRHQDRLRGKHLPDRYELRGIRKDGTICWLEIHASLIEYQGKPAVQAAYVDITERRKAEEALRESEEKYRSIFNTAAGLITSVDRNGLIVDCNARIKDILGYEKDEVAGQSIAKIFHPDYIEKARACLNEILVDGFAHHKEFKMVRKDNEIIDVEINAAGVKDKEGKYVGGICIIQDITERKEAEEALQKRTEELTIINEMAIELALASSTADIYKLVCEKLKSITGALFTAITSYDSQRQELKVEHFSADNEFIINASKLLGQEVKGLKIPLEPYHIEQMLSEKAKRLEGLSELMFDAIPKAMADTLEETLRIGDVYGLLLHYGGKIIGTMPIFMPQQKPLLSIEMLKAFANLVATSLKRMKAEEERVAAVRERAAVIDAMSEALIVLNPDGQIISCNPAHLKMFHRSSADEILGRNFSELREVFCDPEEDIPKMLGVFRAIVQNGLSKPVEVRVRRADGEELTVSASVSLQRDAIGNPLNVIAILRDITPQKRLQEMEREAAVTRMAVEMIEGMLEAVTIMDLDGTIRQVNSEFERGSGYKKEEIVGKTAIELGIISKEENQRIEKEIIPKLMNEGFVRNIETVVMSKDGTRFSALMSWRLMKDAQGNPKSIIATVTDITELKQAEEQLREYQQKLQSMASELSLTEERERRHIATGLHDRIVQPLVFTKMKLDELGSSTTLVDSGKHLEEISNMLDQVIEEIQTLTYDLGSPTLYELGLEAAIEEWLSEEIEQKHNISTFFEADGAPKSLSEDISGFLFRSVRELLVNVVKHGKAQNIKVSLKWEEDRIRICVDDDGVGFKLSDTSISKGKKAGYGLFSIKEHLSHIGGYIDIKSQPNHGTQVVLVAPSKGNVVGT
jgi:PAS domain S-box-containing protein